MKYYPGKKVPYSGIYDEINAFGIRADQITLIKGHLFPELLSKGSYFQIYIAAHHRTLERATAMQARKSQMKEQKNQGGDSLR